MQKNQPQHIRAWCMYDWANSAYSLTITSAIFPTYFLIIAFASSGKDSIDFLFWKNIPATVLYAYTYSFSALLIAIINPLVGSLSDATGKQKLFMRIFCYIGVICCFLLYFSTPANITFAILVFIVSSVAYSCSIVFCNSFLPIIATPDRYESISAQGFALGYIGGVLMLALNLAMIQAPHFFGFGAHAIADRLPARISFVLVGIWWLIFAEYAFYYLPNNASETTKKPNSTTHTGLLWRGYGELIQAGKGLLQIVRLRTFLWAFFFYNMGLQTVMGLATLFGQGELKLPQTALITTILILQLVGAVGALFFGYLSKKIGNIRTLQVCTLLWIGICIYAYTVTTANQFYILAMCVGWAMGGIQALSRASYTKLLPEGKHNTASYFSFYDTIDKVGTVLGTFLYALIQAFTGSMRYSLLVFTVFFLIGTIGLEVLRLDMRKKQA